MSGSSKANEPSMDEILASIRKIIADDPSPEAGADGAGGSSAKKAGDDNRTSAASSFGSALGTSPSAPSAPANPKPDALGADRVPGMRGSDITPPMSGASSTGTAPSHSSSSPSFSRLGDALRGAQPSSSSMPSERFSDLGRGPQTRSGSDATPSRSRSSIENELDDILGEPISPDEPVNRPQAGAAQASDDQWAVWRTQPGKPDDASDRLKLGASGSGSGLESHRPSGFYPSTQSPPNSAGASSNPPFQPKVPGEDGASSGAFGSFVPKKDSGADASPASAAVEADAVRGPSSPRFDARPDGDQARLPADASSSKPVEPPPAKKPVVIAAMPAAADAARDKVADRSSEAAKTPDVPDSTAPPSGSGVPLPPRNTLFSKPFSMSPEPKPAASEPRPQPDQPAAAAPSAAPAAQPALPRAAAQVAASSAALNALVAAQPAQESPEVTAGSQQGGLQVSSGQPRTLEDMVADMVKPMLQKWLQDNMPRIIEKALRVEVSQQQQANSNRKPPQT